MSAQFVRALLARADQLDEEVTQRTGFRPLEQDAPEDPRWLHWLAEELRAIARIAQEPGG